MQPNIAPARARRRRFWASPAQIGFSWAPPADSFGSSPLARAKRRGDSAGGEFKISAAVREQWVAPALPFGGDGAKPLRIQHRGFLKRVELREKAKLDRGPKPWRPESWEECRSAGLGTKYPCPYYGCRHHLGLEASDCGSIQLVFPSLEPQEMRHTCSLVAARGGTKGQVDIGKLMRLSIRSLAVAEHDGLRKLQKALNLDSVRDVQRALALAGFITARDEEQEDATQLRHEE